MGGGVGVRKDTMPFGVCVAIADFGCWKLKILASDEDLVVKSGLFSVAGLWSPHSTTVGVGTAQSCIDWLYNQQHLLFISCLLSF